MGTGTFPIVGWFDITHHIRYTGTVSKIKPVSIKEISELTGVSIATVSRVINNNGRFSEATRKKVQSVIREHDYVPNAMAQWLRTNRTRNIGIIVPDITNEFFAKLTLDIQQKLFTVNYSTLIYNTNEDPVLEKQYLQAISAQNVRGIIFISGGGQNGCPDIPDVPMIFLDREPHLQDTRTNYVRIQTDHVKGAYLAGEILVKKGCKNPAILMYKNALSPQSDRVLGFKTALNEAQVSLKREALLHVNRVSYDDAYAVIKKSLERGCIFDGYFCTTDWLAVGAMDALLDHGIKIPRDAKIIGFDDVSIAAHGRIPLTTIHQDTNGMAHLAVELMLKLLNNEQVEKFEYYFEPKLIKRRSV
ncbi:MAG: LacI family transcriptional regulator [Spirochaetaceae bacterium]|jgi:LacI family transcriptional regulator|nr:LacI family transcriptional regulator [Spirochaetaceae bacterium]